MGDAGVVQEEAIREVVDRKPDVVMCRRAGLEVQRGEAAVDRRVVILDAGGDAEEARLEIADRVDQQFAFECRAGDLGERADERDRQRLRSAEA